MTRPGAPVDFWGPHLDPTSGVTAFLHRLTGNAAAVGLPLLTLVYLAIYLMPLTDGWAGIPVNSPWSSLPHFAVPGVLLLVGALGFGLAELSHQRDVS